MNFKDIKSSSDLSPFKLNSMFDYVKKSVTTNSKSNKQKMNYNIDLHEFKMNLSKTLQSNSLLKFNDKPSSISLMTLSTTTTTTTTLHPMTNLKKIKKLKIDSFQQQQQQQQQRQRISKFSSTPRIPVKFDRYYFEQPHHETTQSTIDLTSDYPFYDRYKAYSTWNFYSNDQTFIQSKYSSPFLLRKPFLSTDSSIDCCCIESPTSPSHKSITIPTQNVIDSGTASTTSTQLFYSELKETILLKQLYLQSKTTTTKNDKIKIKFKNILNNISSSSSSSPLSPHHQILSFSFDRKSRQNIR
jgi:hypothetical protein